MQVSAGSAVGSAQIVDDSIVNADVNSAAALAGSKLQALVVGTNAGVIPSTGVADAHVSASAAIAGSKLSGVALLTGAQTIADVKTFSSDPLIPDEAYGAGWNGVLEPPTKNAVYDKIESLALGTKVGRSTTQYAVPADTAENLAYTVSLAAGVLGTTNALKVTVPVSAIKSNSGAGGTIRVKLGGTVVGSLVWGTLTGVDVAAMINILIMANDSASAQKTVMDILVQSGGVYAGYATSAVDTSGALDLTLTVQKGDAGANITLQGILVEKIV